MPTASPAMLEALGIFVAVTDHPGQDHPALETVTTHVWQALAARGLVHHFPDPTITTEGRQAYDTGRIPRIITSNNITFARLDSGSRPRHYRCYIRKGYLLERREDRWHLTNEETREEVRVPFTKYQTGTVTEAVRNAAPIVRSWIDRDSTRNR